MSSVPTRPPAAVWVRSPAWYRAVVAMVLSVSLGLIVGRIDLVLLALPFAVLLASALTSARPAAGAPGPLAVSRSDGEITSGLPALIHTELTQSPGVQWISVVQPSRDGRPTGDTVAVAGGPAKTLEVEITTQAWGHRVVARPDVIAYGADGLRRTVPARGPELTELLLPATETTTSLEFAPLSGGWAGAHTSRRPGQGNDLVDLRQFQPGDRLKSIHWRSYARHQKLYTRRTLSEADADIMLCLDLRSDIGPSYSPPPITIGERAVASTIRGWRHVWFWFQERRGGPDAADRAQAEALTMRSSLDLLVYSATAIAASQLGAGDRVGVLDISTTGSRLRLGTGNRHLHRLRYHLAQLNTGRRRPPLPLQWWALPSNAVVIFFSPLLDNAAETAVLDSQVRGHQVMVVDVLPLRGLATKAGKTMEDQLRILAAEREMRLRRLRSAGVPVLTYEGEQLGVDLAAATRALRRRR